MSAIALTPLGRSTAENTSQSSTPEFTVLSTLYEADGPVDFDEIVDALHTTEEKASMIVRKLINKELCKEV